MRPITKSICARFFLLAILSIICIDASAYDFEVDGISYNYNGSSVTVTYGANYTGEVSIPESVYYNENTYSVTAIDDWTFDGCSDMTSITIPRSVTAIGYHAFSDCSGLTSITIPNGVTSIGVWAFAGCSGLTSINIPNSVTAISNYTFAGCSSLTSITIPNRVTKIFKHAFQGCSSLTSVNIPNSVTSIDGSAFEGCIGLTSIKVESGNSVYDSRDNCNAIIKTGTNTLILGCEKTVIPNSVTAIGDWAFAGYSSITSITIPNSVTSIGYSAFNGCSGLTSVTIPDNVTTIGGCAFYECSSLTSVIIPNRVTIIDSSTFYRCRSLISVTIPNSVTSLGFYSFADCSSLTSITIPNSVTTIDVGAFRGCSGLTSVNIPNSVKTIGARAFEGCCSLTSVNIPNSVTDISYYTFAGCSSLTSITIPNSMTAISNDIFSGCSSLTSITIPNSVTSIGSSAFNGCSSLTSITIPNSVTTIGGSAFHGCSSLTSITIPNGVTSIDGSTFQGCSSLTSVTIPNGVTSIGGNAFQGCSSLTSINIPNSVTTIGGMAFSGCSSLTSVTIPNGVTCIDYFTFENCSSLISVTIPNTVTSIEWGAFEDCSSLLDLFCLATEVPAMEYNEFTDIPLADATLHVPVGCKETYEAVSPWNEFGTIVEENIVTDLFPDCPEGEIRDAAIYLYNKGIVKGENGLLLADREATRAEVAKVSFYGAYFGPANVPENLAVANFPSVYEDIATWTADNDFYYLPARSLLYLEYGDGVTPFDRNRLNFEPDNKIARVDVLKVLLESFNIQPDINGNGNPFPNDVDVVALANKMPVKMGYIRKAASLGIIMSSNAEFHPYAECTRGQAFLMLARIMRKIEAGEITDPAPKESDYFQPLNTTLATIGLGVSLQMGNFQHYSKTSFFMNGVMPLSFSHTYNSYNTTLPSVFFGAKTVDNMEVTYQPMGDGWSHNYHSFITVIGSLGTAGSTSNMRAVVHWGGGGIDVYKSENGELKPVSMGVYDEISIEGGEVLIKSKSQVEYRFSPLGSSGANVLYLNSITDRNGNMLTIDYEEGQNGSKRISSVSDGKRSLNFYYLDGTDLLEEVKDTLNRTVSFTYFDNKLTGKKQLKTFTDAEGHTTTYDYLDLTKAGASKLLSRIQLPKGNYIENEYDANHRLTQTVKGQDDVPTTKTNVNVETSYGSNETITQSTVTVDRGWQSSTYHYTYNNNNVVTNLTGDQNLFVNRTYDNAQHPEKPTSIQDNNMNVSSITYDKKGNVTSISVTGDGTLTTQMTYDEKNNLTSFTDPRNNTTTYTYDDNGNLVEVLSPIDGIKTSITIGEKGLPVEIKNAMDVVTKYQYNEYGNTVAVSLPALGISNTREYDGASRLVKMTDALERTTSFTYNDNDLLTTETDPAHHTTTYSYDRNDNLTSITNAKNGVTTLSYDNATDWLLSVEFAGSTKQYSYNSDGTLNSYIKPDGTTQSYLYDALGRVVNDGVCSYTYDDNLRLSSISAGNKTLSLTYDNFNRITGTSCNGHNNNYTYDNNGNRLTINGTTYGYDELNRLTSVTFGGKTINYTYRKDSQLSTVNYPNGMTTTYGYDKVGRLTSKQTMLSNGTVIASYELKLDNVGNILEQTSVEPYNHINLTRKVVSYSYNNANHITKAGDISFEFDANGNATSRGNETYQWDVRDYLTNANGREITYDPLGLISSYGDIKFTADPLGMGNVLSDSRSGAQYIYGNGLEARVINGTTSFYVTDIRGSVVAIVDNNGNITHKYQYDDFGNVVQKEEADYNPFQYVGKYGVMYLTDHLYYMRARHYDPTIGRFLSEDPIWSTNLYPYADNNPIMGIDPRGLYTKEYIEDVRNGAHEICRKHNSGKNLENCYNYVDTDIANRFGDPTNNIQELPEFNITPEVDDDMIEDHHSAIEMLKESVTTNLNQKVQNNTDNYGSPNFSFWGTLKMLNPIKINKSRKEGGNYLKVTAKKSDPHFRDKYPIIP